MKIALILVLILLQTAQAEEAQPQIIPHVYPVTEFEVYDGDTIKVIMDLGMGINYKTSVRVDGINAPEVRGEEKAAGLVVKSRVEEWLKDRKIYVKYLRVDKYGSRIVGKIIRDDGSELSPYLLQANLAKAYEGDKKPTFSAAEITLIAGSE